MTLKVQKNYNK